MFTENILVKMMTLTSEKDATPLFFELTNQIVGPRPIMCACVCARACVYACTRALGRGT